MIKLDNVTLFSVDCKFYERTILAMNECTKHFTFKEVVFIGDRKPTNLPNNIKFIKIHSIKDLGEYSSFMIKDLPDLITTDYCMSVHHDGWIINPNNWRDEFLKYDYVGAPWSKNCHFLPQGEKYRVGNGGVSIRSKKLMHLAKQYAPNSGYHEDTLISHTLRNTLENNGVVFAPLEIAKYFSYELPCDDLSVSFDDVLAFHGRSHTKEHVGKMKYITSIYYRDVVTKLSKDEIRRWLKEEAGSQQPEVFFGNFRGNLLLQQIPDEYANLLDFLRSHSIRSYLELGVGNGGSFFTDCIFIGADCKKFHAVDNIGYAGTHIQQTEEKIMGKVNLVSNLFPESEVKFFNSTTDNFFENNTEKYDCIFIDADHSYAGVKKDYENALRYINEGGVIIFHDIGNTGTGVARCWNEIKGRASSYKEFLWKPDFVDFYNCGIGIYLC